MRRQWLGCLCLFAFVFLLVYELNSTVSIAQPTESTQLSPPQTVTPMIMKCYGQASVTYQGTTGSVGCGPGSQNYNSIAQCPAGQVAIGQAYIGNWFNSTQWCQAVCGTVDLNQSNCQWRLPGS